MQKSALKGVLNEIPAGVSVTIDGTGAQFIDHDIIEVVRDFEMSGTKRGIKIHLKNLRTKRMVILGVRDGKLQEPLARK